MIQKRFIIYLMSILLLLALVASGVKASAPTPAALAVTASRARRERRVLDAVPGCWALCWEWSASSWRIVIQPVPSCFQVVGCVAGKRGTYAIAL